MEKLPPTSYVRLVDIWLICGQLIAFIEVILLTLRELYNEEDKINHHGSVRRIWSISKVSFLFLVHNKSKEMREEHLKSFLEWLRYVIFSKTITIGAYRFYKLSLDINSMYRYNIDLTRLITIRSKPDFVEFVLLKFLLMLLLWFLLL